MKTPISVMTTLKELSTTNFNARLSDVQRKCILPVWNIFKFIKRKICLPKTVAKTFLELFRHFKEPL